MRQQEQQAQQQLVEQQNQAKLQEQQMKMQFEAGENAKDREARILEAEIRAAGEGAGSDINMNQMSDYQDAMANIQKQQNYTDTANFKREQEANKSMFNQQKLGVEREKLQTQRDIAEKQLQIARENKNKYDVKKPPKKS